MKKELPIRQSVNFTVEKQARKGWDDISKVLKGGKKKNLQLKILYSRRLSFRNKREIKNLLDQQKLKEFITTKLSYKKC